MDPAGFQNATRKISTAKMVSTVMALSLYQLCLYQEVIPFEDCIIINYNSYMAISLQALLEHDVLHRSSDSGQLPSFLGASGHHLDVVPFESF